MNSRIFNPDATEGYYTNPNPNPKKKNNTSNIKKLNPGSLWWKKTTANLRNIINPDMAESQIWKKKKHLKSQEFQSPWRKKFTPVKFCEYQSRCGRQNHNPKKNKKHCCKSQREYYDPWDVAESSQSQTSEKQDTMQISRIVSISSGKKAHQRQYKALRSCLKELVIQETVSNLSAAAQPHLRDMKTFTNRCNIITCLQVYLRTFKKLLLCTLM